MQPLKPVNSQLFFSKHDPRDQRLGEFAKPCNNTPPNNSICLVGYADHEGIRLNGGRLGAAEAPTKIREFLYKMTPPIGFGSRDIKLVDCGDLTPDIGPIETRHTEALNLTQLLYRNENRVVSFGGGHDYGYPDASAFVRTNLENERRPLVINFDAHLDVRPTDKGPNSGTPFYRLLNEFKSQFDFIEIGLQPQCNSASHAEWAADMGAKLYWLDDVQRAGGTKALLMNCLGEKPTTQVPVFLSFDIDALNSAQAPGCSQSWATGLELSDSLAAVRWLKKNTDFQGLGIYEVSPPLDSCNITVKTAAQIAYHFLFGDLL